MPASFSFVAQKWQMTGFEPRSSAARSNRYANCATTTLVIFYLLLLRRASPEPTDLGRGAMVEMFKTSDFKSTLKLAQLFSHLIYFVLGNEAPIGPGHSRVP